MLLERQVMDILNDTRREAQKKEKKKINATTHTHTTHSDIVSVYLWVW